MANFLYNFFGTQANMEAGRRKALDEQADTAYKQALAREATSRAAGQEYQNTIAPDRFNAEQLLNDAQVQQTLAGTKKLLTDEQVTREIFHMDMLTKLAETYKQSIVGQDPKTVDVIRQQYQSSMDEYTKLNKLPRYTLSADAALKDPSIEDMGFIVNVVNSLSHAKRMATKDVLKNNLGRIAGQMPNPADPNSVEMIDTEVPNQDEELRKTIANSLQVHGFKSNSVVIDAVLARLPVVQREKEEASINEAFKFIADTKERSQLAYNSKDAKALVDLAEENHYARTGIKMSSALKTALNLLLTSTTPQDANIAMGKAQVALEREKFSWQKTEANTDRSWKSKENALDRQHQKTLASMGGGSGGGGGGYGGSGKPPSATMLKEWERQDLAADTAYGAAGQSAYYNNVAEYRSNLNNAVYHKSKGLDPKNPNAQIFVAGMKGANEALANLMANRIPSSADGTSLTVSGSELSDQRMWNIIKMAQTGVNKEIIKAVDDHFIRGAQAIGGKKFNSFEDEVKYAFSDKHKNRLLAKYGTARPSSKSKSKPKSKPKNNSLSGSSKPKPMR